MSAILEQLGLDQTFFTHLVLFAIIFLVLRTIYFKPFLKLFERRYEKTTHDREAAEKLMMQADTKFEEYKRILAEERASARKFYEELATEAKKEENEILSRARDEAKKITQDAAESVARQREQLKQQLEVDVESIAHKISEKLLLRKV